MKAIKGEAQNEPRRHDNMTTSAAMQAFTKKNCSPPHEPPNHTPTSISRANNLNRSRHHHNHRKRTDSLAFLTVTRSIHHLSWASFARTPHTQNHSLKNRTTIQNLPGPSTSNPSALPDINRYLYFHDGSLRPPPRPTAFLARLLWWLDLASRPLSLRVCLLFGLLVPVLFNSSATTHASSKSMPAPRQWSHLKVS